MKKYSGFVKLTEEQYNEYKTLKQDLQWFEAIAKVLDCNPNDNFILCNGTNEISAKNQNDTILVKFF